VTDSVEKHTLNQANYSCFLLHGGRLFYFYSQTLASIQAKNFTCSSGRLKPTCVSFSENSGGKILSSMKINYREKNNIKGKRSNVAPFLLQQWLLKYF
jgi:hypothetical protein